MGKRQKKGDKLVVQERISRLFSLSRRVFKESPELSNRYVKLARDLGMRFRVKIPTKYKKEYCKKCHTYLKPGVSSKIRLSQNRQSKVMVSCLACGNIMRYPYSREKEKA
ncbi:MAG: ribonuclease P [archaeon]|jgi:ribonuclease P protein subunit RPR2|nr:ribonuclease P [Euryarchaeota archaeon]MDP6704364.1 ribonuclease P [archaeon]MDP7260538.1 ribonuclease P [archaeon]HIK01021.1 ribonuclease P [Candidatus Undinarchaeales archaeon ERR594346 U_76725]